MRIVLCQTFPLGRFHATPWAANPFDDPHGEWPPSPWRLVRAVAARWYQWAREADQQPDEVELEKLLGALCRCTFSFHLPPHSSKGVPLRQYKPVEFEIDPPKYKAFDADFFIPESGVSDDIREKLGRADAEVIQKDKKTLHIKVKKAKTKKAIEKLLGKPISAWKGLGPESGFRSYSIRLDQDNYWCMPPDADGAVWWMLDGDNWNDSLLAMFDHCLERMTYFGRAESFTRIERTAIGAPKPNCTLEQERNLAGAGAVPVLVPRPDTDRSQIEGLTGNLNPTTPPGAQVMYALRPSRPSVQERPKRPRHHRKTNLLQFAIGWNVAPRRQVIVRLTSRFRGTVIKKLLHMKSGDPKMTWSRASTDTREAMKYMTGKDATGMPLKEPHQHTEFFAWCEDGQPTRLLVWRDQIPFDADEQTAIFRAASQEFAWAGNGPDTWRVKLIPLDSAVPPPPGFNGVAAKIWESLTPYVPPRHYLRGGKPRPNESVEAQIQRELEARGLLKDNSVVVSVGGSTWVAAHTPRAQRLSRSHTGDRRGYQITLRFDAAVHGPLRLGHSSSFGLGLFLQVE